MSIPWRPLRLHPQLCPRQRYHVPQLQNTIRWVRHKSDDTNTNPSLPTYKPKQNAKDPAISTEQIYEANNTDPLASLNPMITTDFQYLHPKYSAPTNPIVLAHGLMGFDELRLLPYNLIPGVQYWRGITAAYRAHNIECITTTVSATGSIEDRAASLFHQIRTKCPGRAVNIVAHSMGGLDARYLISRLCPTPADFTVKSLTTVATPHRGSSAADMLFREIGPDLAPRLYRLLGRLKIDSGAFSQLTREYIGEHFNKVVPNSADVRYFSYGASATPHFLSVFRISHDLMEIIEGANDGLVSVRSSRWGEYKGTLMGVTHLDLINWTNRIKYLASRLGLVEQRFDAIAFYLGVADMLADEGL
jgi:triacylglycerol lipase